ncbi:MAG: protein adenylyltransferase SelO [Polyangiales bacterium]
MSRDAPLFAFDNSYARLPERFFARVAPTPTAEPGLVRFNASLARQLGVDPERLATDEALEVFAGNRVPEGSDPIATAYAGFQFGNWVPQLGDGRAILLGEVVGRDGVRRDVQLKGSGRTPFSRGGDGRAGLGPVLREYVVSEAMAALGVPTTRSLAAVTTGERILRETPLPGAVLTRVAESHIRVGTFQYFAGRQDVEGVRLLAEHVIARHYPEAAETDNPLLAMLDAVVGRQAELIARWQLLGFIHGVMNTDNSSIAGETIDYGPCAFMDQYHRDTVFSSIDRTGRYAYGNQPSIAFWNLRGLAEALLPAVAEDPKSAVAPATEVLRTFPDRFERAYRAGMNRKLGIGEPREGDEALAEDLLTRMADNRADFTLTFRGLSELGDEPSEADASVSSLFEDPRSLDDWTMRWRQRLASESRSFSERRSEMRSVNPAFIPRNHRLEEVIQAASSEGDFSPFETLMEVLASPYEDQPARAEYAAPPRPDEVVRETFCGT